MGGKPQRSIGRASRVCPPRVADQIHFEAQYSTTPKNRVQPLVKLSAFSLFAPAPRHQLVPHWAIRFGLPGLAVVAALDASIIPLAIPGSTDLLLLWLVSHGGNPWLLTSIAITGSLVGGYTTWALGKKGGHAALERWVPARIVKRITGWVEGHPIMAVALPPILPPPIPLAPFLLAAGALGVSRRAFLLTFGSARAVRYSLVAWLAIRYGRHIIRLWAVTLAKWQTPLLCVFITVIVAGLIMGIWKLRKPANSSKQQPAPARAN
jgi:membrane protein YqaA with SNARE-associated domain